MCYKWNLIGTGERWPQSAATQRFRHNERDVAFRLARSDLNSHEVGLAKGREMGTSPERAAPAERALLDEGVTQSEDAALAHGMGISQPSVRGWQRMPAERPVERVVAVVDSTGISRTELRPDHYRSNPSISNADLAHPQHRRDTVIYPIDEIDQERALHYSLLATLLVRPPRQETLDQVAVIPGGDSTLGRALGALATAAQATDQDRASQEYFNLFIGVGRGDVLPYASFYRTGFLHARPLSQMRADLARFGFVRDPAVFEPEDHIGTMLEVMAALIRREVAADAAEPDQAGVFFKQHIEPWGERLFEDIALAPSAKFYRAVAELGRLWLDIEQQASTLPG